jgi:hypothetical protein
MNSLTMHLKKSLTDWDEGGEKNWCNESEFVFYVPDCSLVLFIDELPYVGRFLSPLRHQTQLSFSPRAAGTVSMCNLVLAHLSGERDGHAHCGFRLPELV